MMVLAVTLHNIPEGMAVGVMYAGFLAGNTQITAASALVLSLGIAIQNFPEGAIISMPLRAEGESKSKAFLGGVLSGVVEPIGAVLTLLAAQLVISSELCRGRHALRCGGGADSRNVAGAALESWNGVLCRRLQRHDDAGCGAGIGAEVPLLLRQRRHQLRRSASEAHLASNENAGTW